ncbi:hypothetical protein [Escherichia coli]|uniref:hypothetical protein n=1 Tax=Escherichia coli TaxID=562 RepID=UPI0024AE52DE|nr:hypothetical protein [Escherichia coli]WHI14970.1 hypothetical protein QDW69_16190 [Escherichia coli]
MKQNNFSITVYSNTADTAKFQYDAYFEIRNYGSLEAVTLTNGTNIYKEENIDSLYTTLYHAGSNWKKEYRGLERKKATLKAMIKEDQREVHAIAFKDGDESYVVSILQDEAGSLFGNMIHASRRDAKGRFVNGKVKNFALASSVVGAWSDCAHGEKFNISFFVSNKAKLNVNAVDKAVWKETTKEKTVSNYEEELQQRDIQILSDAHRAFEQRLAEMERKFAMLMEENISLKKEIEVLEIRVEELEAKEVKAPEVKEVEAVAVVPAATQEEAKEEKEAPEAVTVDQPIIKPALTVVSCDISDASLNNLLDVEEGYKPYVPTIPAMDEMDRELLDFAA